MSIVFIQSVFRAIIALVAIVFVTSSYSTEKMGYFPGQVTIDVQQAPTPLKALNKYYLVYELNLTNFQKKPITLVSLTITPNKGETFQFSGKKLADITYGIGYKNPENEPLVFQPGIAKMIYLFLPIENETMIPTWMTHKIKFKMDKDVLNFRQDVTSDPMYLSKDKSIIVSAPLQGDNWLAGNGASNTSAHRITHLVFHGHDYFAQRYAIDFVQIGKNGITHSGDRTNNKNYYAYGKDVLSVAAGRVVEVKDNIPENIPQSDKLAVTLSEETIGGNHVIVDIGHGKYAFYGHMIPHSIHVKVGDAVTRGQVLGKLGNSGNSSEPHLHFHIVDRPNPLGGNGLAYGFDHFAVRDAKSVSDKTEEIHMEIVSDKLQSYENQLVLEDTLMKFD